MAMNIIELYKHIYEAAGLITTSDGFVKRKVLDTVTPFLIEGKSLVLPTSEHLRNPDKEHRVLGHMLRETVTKGPSVVFEEIRKAMSVRLSVVTGMLALELLELAASPAEHAKLNPDQSAFLSIAKDADEKMTKNFVKLLKQIPLNQTQKGFASIYIKRSANLDNRTYKRGAIATFPVYQALLEAEKEVYGVTLRPKDIKTISAILKYIYPDIDTANAYSHGSDSDVAPSTDALMGTVRKFAARLHDILDLFGSYLTETADLRINTEWEDQFQDLEAMLPQIRAIPAQLGNEGASTRQEIAQAAAQEHAKTLQPEAAVPAAAPVASQQVASLVSPATAAYTPAPAPTPAPGKVDIGAVFAARAPVYPGMAYPNPGVPPGYPVYPGMVPAYPGMAHPGAHPGMIPAGYPGMPVQTPYVIPGGHPGAAGRAMPHASTLHPALTGQFGMNQPLAYHPGAHPGAYR